MFKYVCQILLALGLIMPLMGHSQTCKTQSIPATTPTNQFTLHNNGTVTDNKTGLMWKQCSEGQSGNACEQEIKQIFTQYTAVLQYVTDLNAAGGYAGYKDWRLPNVKELASIVERQCYDPAINLAIFPQTLTATELATSKDTLAWLASTAASMVNFRTGNVMHTSSLFGSPVVENQQHYIRLVRDAK